MSLVWFTSSFTWYHIGCYSQFNWSSFPVYLHNHFHFICWKSKKGNDWFPITNMNFVFSAMTLNLHFLTTELSLECKLQLKMGGLLLAVFVLFAIIVFVSIRVFDSSLRRTFVGYLSVASLIFMFASPLFIIVSTKQTRKFQKSTRTLILDAANPFFHLCGLTCILCSRNLWSKQGVLNSCPFIFLCQLSWWVSLSLHMECRSTMLSYM